MAIITLDNKKGKSYQVKLRDLQKNWITKCYDRKRDAQLFEKETILKITQGKYFKSDEMTFAELTTLWKQRYAEIHLEHSTKRRDFGMLNNWILPKIGEMKLPKISSKMIEDIGIQMKQQGNAPSSINKVYSTIGKIWNFGVRSQEISTALANPIMFVQKMKEKESSIVFWSKGEIKIFLDYISNKFPHYFTFFVFMLNTGVRVGEGCAIKKKDISISTTSISISSSYDFRSGRVKPTKTCKNRHIGINDFLLPILEKHIKSLNDDDFVFQSKGGKNINNEYIRRKVFLKTIKETGIRSIRIHDLRHSYASHYVMNGGNLYKLQKILGHASITMTQRYAHLAKEHLIESSNVAILGN